MSSNQVGTYPTMPFAYVDAVMHEPSKRAYVFVVQQSGQLLTLEDDYYIFPSDGLIARLKLVGP